MSDASKRDEEPTDESDRVAIFARRQRFIAIALGMLSVAACSKPGWARRAIGLAGRPGEVDCA